MWPVYLFIFVFSENRNYLSLLEPTEEEKWTRESERAVTEERDSLCDKNSQAASAAGSLPKKSTKSGGSCVREERLEMVAGEDLFEKIDVHGGELASVEDLMEDSDCELVVDNEAHRVTDSVVDLGADYAVLGDDTEEPAADTDEVHGADNEEPAADTDELRADIEEHLAEADQQAAGEEGGQEQSTEDTEHGPSCDCLDCDDADFLHGFVDGEPWGIK
jgi:hypothetical protein